MFQDKASSNRITWVVLAAIAVLLLFALVSIVTAQNSNQQDRNRQSQNQQNQRSQSQQPRQGTNYIQLSNLTGKAVYSQDGQEIGQFEDVVFDENRENAAYIVISANGTTTQNKPTTVTTEEYHALPWSMVESHTQGDRITIPIEASVLEERTGFIGEYPNPTIDQRAQQWTSIEDWEQSSTNGSNGHSMDGQAWSGAGNAEQFKIRKGTEFIGLKVNLQSGGMGGTYGMDGQSGRSGGYEADQPSNGQTGYQEDKAGRQGRQVGGHENFGEIDDVLLTPDGTPEFVVVKPEPDVMNDINENEVVAVPWMRVQLQPNQELVIANLTEDEARELLLNEDELNRLNDPNFREQFFTVVGTNGRMQNGHQKSNGENEKLHEKDGEKQRNGKTGDGTNGIRQDGSTQPRQRSQGDEIQKWSNFAQQCLGSNLQRGSQTITGTIQSTGTFRTGPNADAPDGRSFMVMTEEGDRVTVYVGPHNRVASNLDVSKGDNVTVKGTRCQVENNTLLVASSIQTDNEQYTLSRQGDVPTWDSQQLGQGQGQGQRQQGQRPGQAPQMSQWQRQAIQQWTNFADQCLGQNFDNASQTIRGTIHNVGTYYTSYNAEAPDGRRFAVDTDNNQRIKVYLGPSGSVIEPLNFGRGNQVTIRGTRCPIEREQVFVATSIEAYGQTFTLVERNGVPHWMPEGQDQNRSQQGQRQGQGR